MDIRPIRNDEELQQALAEIETLWDAPAGSPEGERLELLAMLVEKYEDRLWPQRDLDPVELLEYAFTEMGHSQAELARLIGSRSRASEIMSRKRPMTLEMIRAISQAWHIPIALLAKPYPLAKSMSVRAAR